MGAAAAAAVPGLTQFHAERLAVGMPPKALGVQAVSSRSSAAQLQASKQRGASRALAATTTPAISGAFQSSRVPLAALLAGIAVQGQSRRPGLRHPRHAGALKIKRRAHSSHTHQVESETSGEGADGETQTPAGSVLVVGGDTELGKFFIDSVLKSSNTDDDVIVVRTAELPHTQEDANVLLQDIQRRQSDLPLVGLVYLAAASPSDKTTQDSSQGRVAASGMVAALDMQLRALMLLVSSLTPILLEQGLQARVLVASSALGWTSPAAWPSGTQPRALTGCFVEQYLEVLANELYDSCVNVYGVRVPEIFLEAASSWQPKMREQLREQLLLYWQLSRLESHGKILPVRAAADDGMTKLRGGNVCGPSLDATWALRAAASGASNYPDDAKPVVYSRLARALRLPATNLTWCHGASDVIVRASALAFQLAQQSKCAGKAFALMQDPSWAFATRLLNAGGLRNVQRVAYPNPWLGEASAEAFWSELEAKVLVDEPPALVYLVHPHFPTGFKAQGFAERLSVIMKKAREHSSSNSTSTLFTVDQTYAGFTTTTTDDESLQVMALEPNSKLILIRSLSKVEGLAGLRLGLAVTSSILTTQLAGGLPFAGGLYISELMLEGAMAALQGPTADRHRRDALQLYKREREWIAAQLNALDKLTVHLGECPFLLIEGPEEVLKHAEEADSSTLTLVRFPGCNAPSAVCIVAEHSINMETVQSLADGLDAYHEKQRASSSEGFMGIPFPSVPFPK